MLIGEAAARVGTSPRSLRHYEHQGLLSPSREHNGYRVYGQTDVIRAGNIKALLDLGLTTADVHGYVAAGCLDEHLTDERSCPEEITTVQDRLKSVDDMIVRLQEVRARLAEYSAHLDRDASVR